jgi:hypothetical protein
MCVSVCQCVCVFLWSTHVLFLCIYTNHSLIHPTHPPPQVIAPLFKDIPHKIAHKISDNFLTVFPGVGIGLAIYFWGVYEKDRLVRLEWP